MKRIAVMGGVGILAGDGLALVGIYVIPSVALWFVYLSVPLWSGR